MALIQSGATSDLLTVDPTSKAARVTLYDPSGNLINTQRTTYRQAPHGFTPVGSATAPFFTLQGSASKTIIITRVRYSATAATGVAGDFWVAKFGAISGGTITGTATTAAADSSDPAATAVPALYSVVPTTATLIDGFFVAERYETVTAAVSVQPGLSDHPFSFDEQVKGMYLRGVSQWAGVGISAAGTTPLADLMVEWIEF